MLSRSQQAALYYARRRRMAMQVLQSLTPWSEGLDVTAGQYVTSENGTAVFLSVDSGTTGSIAPTGQFAQDAESGGVQWRRADIMSLLTYLYTGAPTP